MLQKTQKKTFVEPSGGGVVEVGGALEVKFRYILTTRNYLGNKKSLKICVGHGKDVP